MYQVGIKNNYLYVVDESNNILVDNPKGMCKIRKHTTTSEKYTFYNAFNDTILNEGSKLENIPMSEIKALNTEFTDFDSTTFENWYTENLGFNPASGGSDAVTSVTTGEPVGSDVVINMVSLTQAEYDAGAKVATTFYIING